MDKKTINQIAAGEVVERPASVVKELVENAIDAKSDKIVIELEGAGKKLIRVTDNGVGISPGELKLAFEKHSTSKISKIEDVYNLSTLGFRGEALASIAAVARVECISCDGKTLPGIKMVLEGGNHKSSTEIGCPNGTTIKVRDLFFNLPARLKYQKADQTELAHIIDAVTHIAIYHYQISFKLIHNGHELLNFPATKNQINNLVNVYGKELVRELIPIDKQEFDVRLPTLPGSNNGREIPKISESNTTRLSVTGFISKPATTRSDKGFQTIYVNGRYVDSKIISDAIKEAYRSLVMKHRYPIVILFLKIDPIAVDVNISPTKLQVRFINERSVYNHIYSSIHNTLKMHDLIPEVNLAQKPRNITLKAITTLGIGKPGYLPSIHSNELATPARELHLTDKPGRQYTLQPEFKAKIEHFQKDLAISSQHPVGDGKVPTNGSIPQSSTLRRINPIGQIMDTYIIAQSGEHMLIIDQHAASERIMYERIKDKYKAETMSTQELLEPIELELSPKELGLLKTSLQTLTTLNFAIDELGENKFYVKGIPIILGRLQEPDIIHDIISDLISTTSEKQKQPEQIKDKMIQVMACKAAIKAGKTMNIPEIKQLLNDLNSIENPYTCAHGRPTIISLSDTQLRKLFKRIV